MSVMVDYENTTVAELRKLACDRSIGSGVWRAGASKSELVNALSGGVGRPFSRRRYGAG